LLEERIDRLKYISSDTPTTEELELFKESRERTGRVIRARWIILGILALYGIVPYLAFRYRSVDLGAITTLQCIFPVAAWCAIAAFNALFLYSHQWFANIRPLNRIQLLLDLLFVTVVVHFSGGAVSWFWAMYLIVTLESAMVMDRDSDTFAFALGGTLAYGGLLALEYHRILSPVEMPFENLVLQRDIQYVFIKLAWVGTTNLGVAAIGVYLMGTIRRKEGELRVLVVKDHLTALYNRGYFYYRLHSEIRRAQRYRRNLSLLLIDLDDFKRVNDRYGHLVGDHLLRLLAGTIMSNIRFRGGRESYELDIPCRYGGDEFAVILPETNSDQAAVAAERLGKEIRGRCTAGLRERLEGVPGALPPDDLDITVSVGVSCCPEHSSDVDGLIKAADDAMYAVKKAAKNGVRVAPPLPAPVPISPLSSGPLSADPNPCLRPISG
jgi:diguanylate cyclase (GGDEF)-like protein